MASAEGVVKCVCRSLEGATATESASRIKSVRRYSTYLSNDIQIRTRLLASIVVGVVTMIAVNYSLRYIVK